MSALPAPHVDPASVLARVRERGGFLAPRHVAMLAQHPVARLWQVLIRCGACRLTCATQDVAHLIRCIEAGGDYVRDVSLIAGARYEVTP